MLSRGNQMSQLISRVSVMGGKQTLGASNGMGENQASVD